MTLLDQRIGAREIDRRPPLVATAHADRPRAITWRSVTMGLAGTVLICAFTPYNDYVLRNTYIVGNNLPLGAMVLAFLVAVCANGPLSRFAPRYALSSGELGVAMAMVLVGCSMPSSAIMRYLPGGLVYPFWNASSNAEMRAMLESLPLPRWLYPAFEGAGPAEWGNDPITTGFTGRWTGDGPPPYRAWLVPFLSWGLYLAALHGALICLIAIVRRQWYENERLPFPLAQIELSLVEAPQKGRWFNDLLGRRGFWLACGGVFTLHTWNALHVYCPRYFPEIPISYDFNTIMAEPPWRYVGGDMKRAFLFLTAAGVSFLLPGAVSFSLWFFYLAQQGQKVVLGEFTGDPGTPGQDDARFGALLAYAAIVAWIGRHHWGVVLRQAFRGERPDEPRGRYLPYPWAFWGLVGCSAAMVAWVVAAGATLVGGVVITATILLAFFLVARIVAETGLLHNGVTILTTTPFRMHALAGWPNAFPLQTVFMAAHMQLLHHDVRETFIGFGSHGVKVLDQTAFGGDPLGKDTPADRRLGRRLIGLFALVLVVAYTVSFSSMLWTEYAHAVQQNKAAEPVNDYVAKYAPNNHLLNQTLNYEKGTYNLKHSPGLHVTIGAAITTGLSVLRLRYAWWPLHPVGYLCMGTWPLGQLWYSIFLGWLARTVVLRFGGASLYVTAKPIVLGLIIGEAVAAGFWLVMGFTASSMGWTYEVIMLLPH